MIAPSAPQWCTDDFLVGSAEFARRHDLGFHLHALETKVQAVAARSGPSGSVVAHMRDLGVLSEHTTLAHAVWVSDEEIGILGESGCTVVHNPASNLKLASGLAPVPQLAAARVNLALGTDNPSAGDAVCMLDAARLAALLSEAWALNPESWLTAGAVLEAATMGGARSLRIAHEIGSIEPGKKADLLLLNLRSLAFTPLNDVLNQIVYCDSGASIEYVIVAGRVVVQHGAHPDRRRRGPARRDRGPGAGVPGVAGPSRGRERSLDQIPRGRRTPSRPGGPGVRAAFGALAARLTRLRLSRDQPGR